MKRKQKKWKNKILDIEDRAIREEFYRSREEYEYEKTSKRLFLSLSA